MNMESSVASDGMMATFVVVSGNDSLRTAISKLEAENGQEWWFLVVLVGDPGIVLAATFAEIRLATEDDASLLEKPLVEMGYPLTSVRCISPDIALSQAHAMAADSQPGVVVVVDDPGSAALGTLEFHNVMGVIHAGTRQAMATPGAGSIFDLLTRSVPPGAPPIPKMETSRDMVGYGRAEPPEPLLQEQAKSERSDEFVSREREESAEEEASPSLSADAKAADEETSGDIKVTVGGDVSAGGTITVAGRDIIYNLLPPEKQTKEQQRRFEAAFPHEVHREETYDLWVVVAHPDTPPFFRDDQEANIVEEKPDSAVAIEFEVDRSTGELKPAEVEVQVTGDGFEIVGDSSKLLTVYPDGTPDKRRFLVKALETGKQRLIVEYTQDGKLLKEMTIVAEVFAPEKKPVGALNLSFQVAVFGVTLSFATGGGA